MFTNKMLFVRFMIIFIFVSLFCTPVFAAEFDINAKSAILVDANSGQVIYEKNPHEKLPIASVTKVMTMLLTMEALERKQVNLSDMVNISSRAASMGGSQLYMEEGEQQSLETLMKGIAICSANDACVAVAEYIGGSEELFVQNMNKRAAELGMLNSNFINTNGLPVEGHYSTAYDVSLMSRELLKHNKIHEWLTVWMTTITVGLPTKKQTQLEITNTNRLIKTYPGANGIKTGYTGEAGYCLSASATRGNMTLVSVVLGAPSTNIRFSESAKLLDYGFAVYDSINIASQNQIIGKVKVDKGKVDHVNAVTKENVSVLIKKDEKQNIRKEIILKENVSAPVKKGEALGEIVIYKDEKIIKRYPLVSDEDVEKAGILTLYYKLFKSITANN
ncbi:MAG: D-alanyl-D-alanine carboxypeptidase [Clostridiales bacterium]|nr:D-alanyl-D-alanine carboxypeptidase [Clostridiales bacterium]